MQIEVQKMEEKTIGRLIVVTQHMNRKVASEVANRACTSFNPQSKDCPRLKAGERTTAEDAMSAAEFCRW